MPSTADRLAALLAEISETKTHLHALIAEYKALERRACEQDREQQPALPLAQGVH